MELIDRPSKLKGLVRRPLDPLYLQEAGIIDPQQPLQDRPKPGEAWSQDYRIFFNRGSWGNDFLPGYLSLKAPDGFGGKGRQTVTGCQLMLDGGEEDGATFKGQPAVERLEFGMNYSNGNLVGWTTRRCVRFYGEKDVGREIPGTALEQSGLLADEKIVTTVRTKTSVNSLNSSGIFFSDWDLLFRCLSLPFSDEANSPCTVIEELSAPRIDGLLYYAGEAAWLSAANRVMWNFPLPSCNSTRSE